MDALASLIKAVIDFVLEEIKQGRMDVEELQKKPLEYFVTKAGAALKGQAEAESHLPD